MTPPKFSPSDTLEVLTLPLGLSDQERRGYKYYRFKVGKVTQRDGIYFYAENDSTTGWRAKYLQKVEV